MNQTKILRLFPWLTLLVLAANLAVYAWQGFRFGHFGSFSESEMMGVGANVAALSATGDHWRLFSSLFLHASIGHLLANMVGLALVGTVLETMIARWQWLLVYVVGGAFAGFVSASANFDISATTIFMQTVRTLYLSVGASGAVMALAGVLIVQALAQTFFEPLEGEEDGEEEDDRISPRLLKGAVLFVLLNLAQGFVVKSTDNAAHFGGVLFGLLVGVTMVAPRLSENLLPRLAAWVGPLLMLGAALLHLNHEVTLNPEAQKLRELALKKQDEATAADRGQRLRKEESREVVTSVSREEGLGTVVPLAGIVRIAATRDPQRVYLLKNDTESQIIEYDLVRNAPVRTLVDRRYAAGDLWGCPSPQCFGVGVSDIQLDEAAGKAYVSSLVKGAVSRVDLASGAIDYSVRTGRFPSRLLLRGKQLYAFDRTDHSLSVLDADGGKLLRKIAVADDAQSQFDAPAGESMVLSEDGKSLYVLTTDAQLMRVRPDSGEVTRANEADDVLALGRNGQGKVWALHVDGVGYPDSDMPRQRIAYRLEDDGRTAPKGSFMDTDGQHPMVLQRGHGVVHGISARTGRLLRVFPQSQEDDDVFAIVPLDGRRFYLPGRGATQVLDAGKSIAIDSQAQDHGRRLEAANASVPMAQRD